MVTLRARARERTDGRFDATVHDALVAAGYDRTFDELPEDAAAAGQPASAGGGGVTVDGRRITLGPGTRLDLGGIGKGFAAERVATSLRSRGPASSAPAGTSPSAASPPKGPGRSRWTRRSPSVSTAAGSPPRGATAALASRGRRAAPPDRPGDRPARAQPTSSG